MWQVLDFSRLRATCRAHAGKKAGRCPHAGNGPPVGHMVGKPWGFPLAFVPLGPAEATCDVFFVNFHCWSLMYCLDIPARDEIVWETEEGLAWKTIGRITQEKLRLHMFVGSSLVSSEEFLCVGPHVQDASPKTSIAICFLAVRFADHSAWISFLVALRPHWSIPLCQEREMHVERTLWLWERNPIFARPHLSGVGINLFDRNFRQKLVASLCARVDSFFANRG